MVAISIVKIDITVLAYHIIKKYQYLWMETLYSKSSPWHFFGLKSYWSGDTTFAVSHMVKNLKSHVNLWMETVYLKSLSCQVLVTKVL